MTATSSDRDPLDILAEEFVTAYRRGERPSLSEYIRQHPDLGPDIEELFPALVMLEDVRPAAAALDPPPAQGESLRRLGEYRIVREIGRGGMGVVYEAEQESLNRRVAIKVLPRGALDDPRRVERFRREACAAARLHHTNLVPLFGVGEEAGTHYYIMQYIEGRPLDEVLDELRRLRNGSPSSGRLAGDDEAGPSGAVCTSSTELAHSLWTGGFASADRRSGGEGALPPTDTPADGTPGPFRRPDAAGNAVGQRAAQTTAVDPRATYARTVARLGIQVADALAYAAAQGVLHRDVKPSNLLLDMNGTVWLTDFGLAKTIGTPDLTHTGDLFGTLRYMAPERLRGRADVRSDVYALGLTLYEMLALRRAFDDRGDGELVDRITREEPPRLDRLGLDLPQDLVTIVHKAIAKDPADRYQNPSALADDLRRFLEDRPIVARRQSLPEQARRWCRRNPAGASLLAGSVFLVVVSIVAGLWLQNQRAERQLEAAFREGRAKRAVEALFAESESLGRRGLWAEAGAVLAQAEALLQDARMTDLGPRLKRERVDFDLVARVESIRLNRVGPPGQDSERIQAAQAYASAFSRAGMTLTPSSAEPEIAARIRGSSVRQLLVAALDDWALIVNENALRGRLLSIARQVDPDPDWRDRARDPTIWGDRQALEHLALEALRKDPPPHLLATLGVLIEQAGGDAEPMLRAAQLHRPDSFWLSFELAMLLRSRDAMAALAFARAALAKRPQSAPVYNLCGLTAWAAGRTNEAVDAYRMAIELDPKLAAPHTNVGLALQAEGKLEEALVEQQKAVELDPRGALGFHNLAEVWAALGRFEEAIATYRRAIELEPKLALPYNGLGNVLRALGRREEAAAAYREAVALDPNGSAAVHNLGNASRDDGKIEQAIAYYRRAIELDRQGPMAHLALIDTLLQEGRFEEALSEARAWADQVRRNDKPRAPANRQVDRCERLLALNARLSGVLSGEEPPEASEDRRDLAWLCQFHRRNYAAAVWLYDSAFTARPGLADDAEKQDRYNAACAAALAADGRGADAGHVTDPTRTTLRRQAIAWLRAELQCWARLARDPRQRPSVATSLKHWQLDPDLESIRAPERLAQLPAEQRTDCEELWRDVADVQARVEHSPATRETTVVSETPRL